MLQPSGHLCGPPLDSLQQFHVFPMLGNLELDTVLEVSAPTQKNGVEGENHLPQPAGYTSFDAAMIGLTLGLHCAVSLLSSNPQD